MVKRTAFVCAVVCSVGVVFVASGGGPALAQSAARVIQAAELADTPLMTYYNALVKSPVDQIRTDRGVRLGSFGSDLFHDPADSYNEFWALTDRGPNGNPGKRTFVAPEFSPLILYARVHHDQIRLFEPIVIVDTARRPVTGLSNVPGGFDEAAWNYNGETALPFNPNGLDTEGLVRTRDGSFWIVEEYSPSLVHVDRDGMVLDRYVPVNSQLGNSVATTPAYRVKKNLPEILNKRRQNRGFEGIGVTPDERELFLAMQSPLDYPTNALGRASRNVRILRWDIPTERVTAEYVYQFDDVCAFLRQAAGCGVAPGEMKISGIIGLTATSFLVLERTDTAAKVYKVDASLASNIHRTAWDTVATSPGATTTALERLANPATEGIAALQKTLVVDLSAIPNMPNKIEGIALPKSDVLAVVNDNDFGLVDNAAFDTQGRLSNDTGVKSQLLYVQLPAPVQ